MDAAQIPEHPTPGSGTSSDCALQKHLTRNHSFVFICWLGFVLVLGYGLDVFAFFDWEAMCIESNYWPSFAKALLFNLIFNMRIIFVSLIPHIDDVAVTRVVLCWDMSVVLIAQLVTLYRYGFGKGGETYLAMSVMFLARQMLFIAIGIWALLSVSTCDAQRRMWRGLGICSALAILQWLPWSTFVIFKDHCLPCSVAFILSHLPVLYIAWRPQQRQKLQGRFQVWLERRAATRSAATLADLSSSMSPGGSMSFACQHFRCIFFSDMTPNVLSSVAPDAAHGLLARPCSLGTCDAFVSQSQNDDELAKWKSLQSWGAYFVEQSGRDPSLFIHNICVDEKGMELQCLPIFLKGCKRLVVLCGPSHLRSLRCVLEIFLHVLLGGQAENIEFVQVLREGFEIEDAGAIRAAFDKFDVNACQCCESSHRLRLVAIIEATCGCMNAFNFEMQGILDRARPQLSIRSEFV